jgi:sugar phosphate isomerase/epimerase
MKETSRRDFLKASAAGAGLLMSGPRLFGRPLMRSGSGDPFLEIGVCTSLSNAPVLEAAGCAYLEEGVGGFLAPAEPDEKFVVRLEAAKSSKVPVRACNGFLPGTLKAVGPAAKHTEILAYAATAFRRAARAGIATIVWGSGESRRIPDGFSRPQAEEQFRALAKTLASAAGKSGILLVLEPLNAGETNFLNSLKEGAAMVEAVGHPDFKLLADFYHVVRAGETPDSVIRAGAFIKHCHIAENEKRTPPGTAGDDFRPFLKALKKIGYRGGISMECRWDDLKAQLPGAAASLKKQIAEVEAGA